METKECTKCEKSYPLEHFSKKGSGRNTRCSACVAEYYKKYYHDNPDRKQKQIERSSINKKKKTEENRIHIVKAFESGCMDCGTKDMRVLEFDHRGDKVANIASMVGWSTKRLTDEIAKCDVVCANCHKIRTAVQFNTWRVTQLVDETNLMN